jgi:rare lipoprotein A
MKIRLSRRHGIVFAALILSACAIEPSSGPDVATGPTVLHTTPFAVASVLFPRPKKVVPAEAASREEAPATPLGGEPLVAGNTPDLSGYSESGRASWYGLGFHGRRTANGERYDMNALTAAHRTLPLSSYVRVTNTSNDRSIVVRINDRGPFRHSRVIDLSYGAAKALGMRWAGTGSVQIVGLSRAEAEVAMRGQQLAMR